jgi:hypothetical protein
VAIIDPNVLMDPTVVDAMSKRIGDYQKVHANRLRAETNAKLDMMEAQQKEARIARSSVLGGLALVSQKTQERREKLAQERAKAEGQQQPVQAAPPEININTGSPRPGLGGTLARDLATSAGGTQPMQDQVQGEGPPSAGTFATPGQTIQTYKEIPGQQMGAGMRVLTGVLGLALKSPDMLMGGIRGNIPSKQMVSDSTPTEAELAQTFGDKFFSVKRGTAPAEVLRDYIPHLTQTYGPEVAKRVVGEGVRLAGEKERAETEAHEVMALNWGQTAAAAGGPPGPLKLTTALIADGRFEEAAKHMPAVFADQRAEASARLSLVNLQIQKTRKEYDMLTQAEAANRIAVETDPYFHAFPERSADERQAVMSGRSPGVRGLSYLNRTKNEIITSLGQAIDKDGNFKPGSLGKFNESQMEGLSLPGRPVFVYRPDLKQPVQVSDFRSVSRDVALMHGYGAAEEAKVTSAQAVQDPEANNKVLEVQRAAAARIRATLGITVTESPVDVEFEGKKHRVIDFNIPPLSVDSNDDYQKLNAIFLNQLVQGASNVEKLYAKAQVSAELLSGPPPPPPPPSFGAKVLQGAAELASSMLPGTSKPEFSRLQQRAAAAQAGDVAQQLEALNRERSRLEQTPGGRELVQQMEEQIRGERAYLKPAWQTFQSGMEDIVKKDEARREAERQFLLKIKKQRDEMITKLLGR